MEQELRDKIQAFLADNPAVKVIFIDANGDLYIDNAKAVEVAIFISAGDPKVTEIDIIAFLADEEAAKKAAEEQAQKDADAVEAEKLKKVQAEVAEAEAQKKNTAPEALGDVQEQPKDAKPGKQKGGENK